MEQLFTYDGLGGLPPALALHVRSHRIVGALAETLLQRLGDGLNEMAFVQVDELVQVRELATQNKQKCLDFYDTYTKLTTDQIHSVLYNPPDTPACADDSRPYALVSSAARGTLEVHTGAILGPVESKVAMAAVHYIKKYIVNRSFKEIPKVTELESIDEMIGRRVRDPRTFIAWFFRYYVRLYAMETNNAAENLMFMGMAAILFVLYMGEKGVRLMALQLAMKCCDVTRGLQPDVLQTVKNVDESPMQQKLLSKYSDYLADEIRLRSRLVAPLRQIFAAMTSDQFRVEGGVDHRERAMRDVLQTISSDSSSYRSRLGDESQSKASLIIARQELEKQSYTFFYGDALERSMHNAVDDLSVGEGDQKRAFYNVLSFAELHRLPKDELVQHLRETTEPELDPVRNALFYGYDNTALMLILGVSMVMAFDAIVLQMRWSHFRKQSYFKYLAGPRAGVKTAIKELQALIRKVAGNKREERLASVVEHAQDIQNLVADATAETISEMSIEAASVIVTALKRLRDEVVNEADGGGGNNGGDEADGGNDGGGGNNSGRRPTQSPPRRSSGLVVDAAIAEHLQGRAGRAGRAGRSGRAGH